ncbi:MAG: D-2-hydroxyacid dehydrogenase [Rhodovarius sp.]|nr:D-2-hydroxyacid dehydrogenase [Rhodovarius sp.]
MLPPREHITIGFAHVAYNGRDRLLRRHLGLRALEARTPEELEAILPEVDVLCISGMWRNDIPARAPRLRFVQSMSSGTDQFDREVLRAAGIRLASAAGVNAEAVAEHAIALLLALYRRLPEARDNQARRHWRGMISDFAEREDELRGKTLLVVGMGRIGARLIALARAFGMRVIGVRANPAAGSAGADEVHPTSALHDLLPRADALVLVCPLTAETTGLIGAEALAAMPRHAVLVNCARGRVCDQAALIEALAARRIRGAALDVFAEEPLPTDSPLWAMPHVLITPHTAGETCVYEDNVIDILLENLERLWRGEQELVNGVV